ncbi:methyl-accepting chemotaxis sensory transducer with TarH sensor [Duganella sp. CF402]|uniref:methyl-accepting chemotaxis protein n=1 Tax=unclassified Duganella TaxID=2636909 RepID=UPI0008D71EA8|nr:MULTISPECIES: methyl-accepting chemotaxis protein [unclassified Duganella]RZT05977.1 methyl-accepting chemotaxis sensory transducer with TarH sensor [Duganella sp. BK701]SEN14669.1 methyl-accepting chemotaxis sensory transducer with TarH sensor [Duganella sp. CF402]
MKNISVRASLLGVLVLFAVMLLAGAGLGIFALQQSNRSIAEVHHIASQVITINDAYKDTTRTRSALTRGYAALKESDNKAERDSALASAKKSYQRTLDFLDKFDKSPNYPSQDAQLKKDLVDAGRKLSVVLDRASAALAKDDTAAYSAINSGELTPTGAAFSALLEKFQKLGDEEINTLADSRAGEYKVVMWLVALGLLIALAVVFGVHLLLRSTVLLPLEGAVAQLDRVAGGDLTAHIETNGDNEIQRLLKAIQRMQRDLLSTVSRVRQGADVISTGSQELAAGNMELSSRTETQASSLEETAASIEELTSTVKQNSENAQHARKLVEGASATAAQGGEVMQQVVSTMNDINDASRKIVDITGVIDGIAFQTNILALNAAVEAARAGEQGRGFAVVASEVRTLAQRSAAAAKEIKVLIDDSVQKIQLGTNLVEQAGTTMSTLVGDVHQVTQIVGEIAVASREQSEGIDQVNQAVAQMDQVTQQNAALVEEAAAATQSLQDQAGELQQTVSVFKIGDAGDAGVAHAGRLALR